MDVDKRQLGYLIILVCSVLVPPASVIMGAEPPASAAIQEDSEARNKVAKEEFEKIKQDPNQYRIIIAGTQMALGAFGFGTGPFDGILNDKTRQAIRAYQKVRGLKQTGELNADTLRMVNDDHKEFGKTIPKLSPLRVSLQLWDTGHVDAEGTWIIEGNEQAEPRQTTRLDCYKQKMQCIEATADYSDDLTEYLNVLSNVYEVERWDEHEIITRPVNYACVRYTMRIGRAQQEVTGLRLRTNTEGVCKSFQTEMRIRLEDGFKVYWQIYQDHMAKVRVFLQAPGISDKPAAK